MRVTPTAIPDVKLVTPQVFGDDRGWFYESYSFEKLKQCGIDTVFVQDNRSFSAAKGTLRGLHCQKAPFAQTKLLCCTRGEIMDVAVDLRPGSKTYGKWYGVLLSAENKKQFFIPKGFAHGFLVLSDIAEFTYKCSDFYHPNDEGGIIYNDPDLAVEWPVGEEMELVLSDKDTKWGTFAEYNRAKESPAGDNA